MVVKRRIPNVYDMQVFESSVISYGSKTIKYSCQLLTQFESSVISYGSKTDMRLIAVMLLFESSVISYGSKTIPNFHH